MSMDPLLALGRQRIITASAQLEAEVTSKGGGLCTEILRRLKDRAAESLAALAVVDPEDPKAIRALQNEVVKYDEWLAWMREIAAEGRTHDQDMKTEEREELLDYLVQTPEGQQEAIELGLVDDLPRDN